MSEERSVEDRLEQIEKDIEELAFGYRELLMWKRNLAIRYLPTHHQEPHGEERLDGEGARS